MMGLRMLVIRNVKLYFKDKGMFFSSLITPRMLFLMLPRMLPSLQKRKGFPLMLKVQQLDLRINNE